MERSLGVLKEGKFQDAVKHFSGPLPADRSSDDLWIAPQLHGRAVAYIGLNDWKNALADLDAAILAHERVTNDKKLCSCHRVAKLLSTKAMVLDQLGRDDEAKKAQKRASAATTSHSESRYELFHNELDALNVSKKK